MGLVALRVVRPDDRVEEVLELREHVEGQAHRDLPFRSHDPEATALRPKRAQGVLDARTRLELGVQGLVVGAVRVDQVVHPVLVQRAHLRDQARPADGGRQLLVGDLAAEHRRGGVPHRRDDHRPGVDERAVEVEQDDRVAHGRHRSQAPPPRRSARRAAPIACIQ
jgi:hypothetical protein